MDGSLGIMFHFENILIFCTHRSFVSVQALKCEEILKSKYNHVKINKECTYCFEIIYKSLTVSKQFIRVIFNRSCCVTWLFICFNRRIGCTLHTY